mmetsp:Transcript_55759/g.88796  ORF Transcript_55759/g.88796 Transcript_55759/m.88796 type:complete len:136 (-) Transcript_55759:61-468(-)
MPKYNWPFLHCASVTICKQRGLGPNTIAFRVPYNFSKPIIQSYFEQLYGAEIVNVNTLNKDPKTCLIKGKYKRRKYGFKKAFITFAKPFEMDWSQYQKTPHMMYTLHTKYMKARGKKTSSPDDMSLEKKKKATMQ